MMEAVLSNADHPEYGVATIPLPIPRNQYDHCVALLEALEIGDASEADCRLDSLDSAWPVLNRLVCTKVNLDELDYLAKRLDSFRMSFIPSKDPRTEPTRMLSTMTPNTGQVSRPSIVAI